MAVIPGVSRPSDQLLHRDSTTLNKIPYQIGHIFSGTSVPKVVD